MNLYKRTPVFISSSKSNKTVTEWYKPVMDYDRINRTSTGKGAKVAVLDDGIDRDHKYLVGKVKHVFEFTNENFEKGFHSTHIAGIMASAKHGVFKDVELGCFKVLTSADGIGTSDWISQGIRAARIKGYQVINASLGGDVNDNKIESEILNFCENPKFFFICASGNDGRETDYPAAHCTKINGVISVGAAQIKNGEIEIAAFSSRGKVTIIAPGVDILSTLPENKEGMLSGTSMATAFISSMVASSKALYPEFSHETFEFIIKKCTNKIGCNKDGSGFIQMAEFMEMVSDIAKGTIIVPKSEKVASVKGVSIFGKLKMFFGV